MSGRIDSLFHCSVAVDDLERARKFYGEILGCPEGRQMPGRVDFNFFGHHLVAHLAPSEIVGEKGLKVSNTNDKAPLRHFGLAVSLANFEKIRDQLVERGADFLRPPELRQKGTVREAMLMMVRDQCGNVIEFKGLRNLTDVYTVEENEQPQASEKAHA